MPPKRKQTQAEVSDASAAVGFCADCSTSCDCALVAAHHDHVANVFSELPTEIALAQIVGICTRLSSHICGLRHSDVRTNVRALQDCVVVLTQACNSVSFAVADLKALETALHMKLGRVSNALDEAADLGRQRRPR